MFRIFIHGTQKSSNGYEIESFARSPFVSFVTFCEENIFTEGNEENEGLKQLFFRTQLSKKAPLNKAC